MTDSSSATTTLSDKPANSVLFEAAVAAGRAPSILNSQPWRWEVRSDALRLFADRSRQLTSIDPDGRLLTVSCGAALNHVEVALAALGYEASIDRIPASSDIDLLAEVRLAGPRPITAPDVRRYQSVLIRHSDRRPFAAHEPVSQDALTALRQAAAHCGSHLDEIHSDQVVYLAVAAGRAATIEIEDPQYRADLTAWTHRQPTHADGVPVENAMPQVPRRVPVRDFNPDGVAALSPGKGDDRLTSYLVISTQGDGPQDWLRAGEATSATLLTAVSWDLATSVMSDVVEVPGARVLLRSVIGGLGYPQLVIRAGVAEATDAAPDTPRRSPEAVITVVTDHTQEPEG